MRERGDPVVSVCIPSFNRADLIGETLDSIQAQTLDAWEAIVVDDGSTDNSIQVASEYSSRDPRVRLLRRNREPKGAGTCRNIAVESAKGRYVLFLDTDDLLAPFCLEQRVAAMEQDPSMAFGIFSMLLFKKSTSDAERLWNIDSDEDDLVRVLRINPICPGTGTLWRRADFIKLGMWNESLTVWQDIELHLRAFAGEYKYTKRLDLPPDIFLRETESSMSRSGFQAREKLESRALIARKAVELLRENGREQLLPEVRFVCSSVILGAIASGYRVLARDTIEWARNEGILTADDARRFRIVEWLRRVKLDRLTPARVIRDRLTQPFRTPSTLGQVPYRPRPWVTPGE